MSRLISLLIYINIPLSDIWKCNSDVAIYFVMIFSQLLPCSFSILSLQWFPLLCCICHKLLGSDFNTLHRLLFLLSAIYLWQMAFDIHICFVQCIASCSLLHFKTTIFFPGILHTQNVFHVNTCKLSLCFLSKHPSTTMLPKYVVRFNGCCLSYCLTVYIYCSVIAVPFCFLSCAYIRNLFGIVLFTIIYLLLSISIFALFLSLWFMWWSKTLSQD